MCGPRTRSRSQRRNGHNGIGDPRKHRHRKRCGNNRSKKRQSGVYAILRGAKAQQEDAARPTA